ncbi:hypothetical protein Tco_0406588, partial [Tanacetum coccineum]
CLPGVVVIRALLTLQALNSEITTLSVPLLNANSRASFPMANVGQTRSVMQVFPPPPKLSMTE